MSEAENIWVGVEVTRHVGLSGGRLASPGDLSVGGINLLDHQLGIARQITSPDQVCVLTPQGDERVLELIAKHEVREVAPFDFIAMLHDRTKRQERGASVLLRQIAPLRDAADVRDAIAMLDRHATVISASKPPAGHARHKPVPGEAEADYRCLAFEVRRISEFSGGGIGTGEEELLFIGWDSFAELIRPGDEAEVAARIASWRA